MIYVCVCTRQGHTRGHVRRINSLKTQIGNAWNFGPSWKCKFKTVLKFKNYPICSATCSNVCSNIKGSSFLTLFWRLITLKIWADPFFYKKASGKAFVGHFYWYLIQALNQILILTWKYFWHVLSCSRPSNS